MASIRHMSRQVSSGSAGEYQADEHNKGVEGKWVACKDSHPCRERVSLGEWKKRVPLLCSQDWVSKAETEAGHPFPHSFSVLKRPWGNAYLY